MIPSDALYWRHVVAPSLPTPTAGRVATWLAERVSEHLSRYADESAWVVEGWRDAAQRPDLVDARVEAYRRAGRPLEEREGQLEERRNARVWCAMRASKIERCEASRVWVAEHMSTGEVRARLESDRCDDRTCPICARRVRSRYVRVILPHAEPAAARRRLTFGTYTIPADAERSSDEDRAELHASMLRFRRSPAYRVAFIGGFWCDDVTRPQGSDHWHWHGHGLLEGRWGLLPMAPERTQSRGWAIERSVWIEPDKGPRSMQAAGLRWIADARGGRSPWSTPRELCDADPADLEGWERRARAWVRRRYLFTAAADSGGHFHARAVHKHARQRGMTVRQAIIEVSKYAASRGSVGQDHAAELVLTQYRRQLARRFGTWLEDLAPDDAPELAEPGDERDEREPRAHVVERAVCGPPCLSTGPAAAAALLALVDAPAVARWRQRAIGRLAGVDVDLLVNLRARAVAALRPLLRPPAGRPRPAPLPPAPAGADAAERAGPLPPPCPALLPLAWPPPPT